MASLSPPSFHSYQCSPGAAESQQRHVGYSSSNSYRQHHRNEVVTKEKSHHSGNRLRLSALRGKSWSTFADAIGCESSDDESDADTADDDPLAASTVKSHQKRGSIVRLKKKDSALYGVCPMTDPFAVVVCRHCRMVLKAPSLKSHIERQRHEKERKHDYGDAVVKLEKLSSSTERSSSDKTSGVTEKFDKISVVHEKPAAVAAFSGTIEKSEKVEKSVDGRQRHRHFQRKSTTPSENSNDAVHLDAVPSTTESSSASNSPQPRRRKRKLVEEAVETFQKHCSSAAPSTTCRIIVEPPSEIVLRDPSSPPPLAPIAQPSVWIVTPSPAVTIIDGSFVVKPLEQEEPEIDLKDLKVLKPVVKEAMSETATLLTPSNWYATQPRPLTVNTFNMRKLNAQRYVMATQRKLIELGRNLRTEEKVVGGKNQPKTWSFIERSQVFIPFRVTH